MSTVIRIVERADGSLGPEAGTYLLSGDHDAAGGRGSFFFTTEPHDAKRFADNGEAFEFWRRQSTTRPRRPDGKPNRPMTAYTVSIEPAP